MNPLMGGYFHQYDPNSKALALRAFEDNLISDFITKLRTMTDINSMHVLFDLVWYSIDELSEYSPPDRIERMQKHIANKFIERLIQLYTPQQYFNLITIKLSNPGVIRQDLQRALNMPAGPFRSLEIASLENLLNIIQIRENMPAKNPFISKDEEAMFGKCWKGYKKVGMKNKSGRRVPNCVRK
jgi:hypothetical protein